MMAFASFPSILFARRAEHEKRIESKPFMFVQQFSEFVNAFAPIATVHRYANSHAKSCIERAR